MDEIIIDCGEMTTRNSANAYLETVFGWSEGSVSDAENLLWLLQSIEDPVEITFEDVDLLDIKLGDYAEEILSAFEQAESTNDNIKLV